MLAVHLSAGALRILWACVRARACAYVCVRARLCAYVRVCACSHALTRARVHARTCVRVHAEVKRIRSVSLDIGIAFIQVRQHGGVTYCMR